MAKQLKTAGQSRKSHKSRKTAPNPTEQAAKAPEVSETVSDGGSSSTTPATAEPSAPSNPITALVKRGDKDNSLAGVETGVLHEDPTKQWWFRSPTAPARKTADKIFTLRAAGRRGPFIAKKLGLTEHNVRQIVHIARKNGWVDELDEPVDLQDELELGVDRKLVRNLNAVLDGQMTNWQTHEVTIAGLKGRGMFKTHEPAKAEEANVMTAVAIKIVMPPVGAEDQQVEDEQFEGLPSYIEGEALE